MKAQTNDRDNRSNGRFSRPFYGVMMAGALLAGSFGLSACNGVAEADSAAAASAAAESCKECGEIVSISARQVKGDPSAVGTVAGAIVGGVAGHQIGGGSGKDLATVAGAIGGAFAGREVEARSKSYTVYDVTIEMNEGGTRSLTLASVDNLYEGAEVRIAGDRVVPAG